MKKIKEVLLKSEKDIDEAFNTSPVEEVVADLPTPEEAAKKSLATPPANPIIAMAIEQAAARKIKDEYHGFK